MIGTKLEAYFPVKGLGARWTDYADRATRFYALLGISDEAERAKERRALLEPRTDRGDEGKEWLALRVQLLQEKIALVADVMSGKGMRV